MQKTPSSDRKKEQEEALRKKQAADVARLVKALKERILQEMGRRKWVN
jgi:hypothetical protein